MKILLLLLFSCSLSLADSTVMPGDYPRKRIPVDATTDKARIAGSWFDARSASTVALESSGAATFRGKTVLATGTWTMDAGGLIHLDLKDAGANPFLISCYVLGDKLIDDQVCYQNVFVRNEK